MPMRSKRTDALRNAASTPFIWAVLLPVLLADLVVEIYHRICFPLYGIPLVSRRAYIAIDRHKLSYLNLREKIECVYCGYVNGWFRYAGMIAAKTELYWCDIRHQKRAGFNEPPHHREFLEFGDQEAFEHR